MRVLQVLGTAYEMFPAGIPLFLMSADVEAYGGQGTFTLTTDPASAKQFPDLAAAMEYWKTQSKVRPLRMDGRPNRPLTALTVQVVGINQEEKRA